MSPVNLARHADLGTCAWICGTCGARHPITGPAYPICCATRCRLIDAEGTPFVGSPAERLEAARLLHEDAYTGWRQWLAAAREAMQESAREGLVEWSDLVAAAVLVTAQAVYLDQVAGEVAACGERPA